MFAKFVSLLVAISLFLPMTLATAHSPAIPTIAIQGNGQSTNPSISADGRYIAYSSWANNLVSGDTNNLSDIFIYDTQTKTTSRVSEMPSNMNSETPSISADGRYVSFESEVPNYDEMFGIYLRDTQAQTTTLVSVNGGFRTRFPSVSADGGLVAFESASSMVSGDTNGTSDIYVRDVQSKTTGWVSVSSDGTQGDAQSNDASISADGRYVAFSSWASTLVNGDTNGTSDIYVHDTQTGITSRVSVSSEGTQTRSYSYQPKISADGRYVAYRSADNTLVGGDMNGQEDIFIRDILMSTTTRVSVTSAGVEGNGWSYNPSISADGRFVAFESYASNLVNGDTNGLQDVFVHDTQTGITSRVSVSSNGMPGNNSSERPSISADGRYVAFDSIASNLVDGDTNGYSDVFLHDNQTGATTLVSFVSDGIQSYSVSGRVADTNGTPISGVSVSNGTNTVITDANGQFAFTGLPNGTYSITPLKSSHTFSPTSRTVSVPPDATEQNFIGVKIKPWTIMYYLDGDNDLDSTYVSIFDLIKSAGSNQNVNIVVLWDRLGDGNTHYYRIGNDSNLDEFPIQERNMGDPQTLISFVNDARVRFPAYHYALILDDHGSGLGGAMVDDTSAEDIITIPQLGDALKTITNNGTNKIDVLVMNACLMGMIEDAYQFRSMVDYYVASENLQSVFTSGYKNTITKINESSTPSQVASFYVEGYTSNMTIFTDYTMSVGDMFQLENLVSATNSLAFDLNSNMKANAKILTQVLDEVQRYDNEKPRGIDKNDTYIDLSDFALLVYSKFTDSEIRSAALRVMDAVSKYIIFNQHRLLLNSNGVSIFFPKYRSSFYSADNYDFAVGATWQIGINSQSGFRVDQSTANWGPMLVNYFNITQPGGPDDPTPPEVVAKTQYSILFLPIIKR